MFPSQDNATHHELAVDMEDWSGNRRFARWLFSSTTKTKTKTKKDKDRSLLPYQRQRQRLVGEQALRKVARLFHITE